MPKVQPGIESVAKQYLYQLAYRDFIIDNNINYIKNYFLLPAENNDIIDKGEAKLDMLHNLGLENIGIKFIPVETAYDGYLNNKKLN